MPGPYSVPNQVASSQPWARNSPAVKGSDFIELFGFYLLSLLYQFIFWFYHHFFNVFFACLSFYAKVLENSHCQWIIETQFLNHQLSYKNSPGQWKRYRFKDLACFLVYVEDLVLLGDIDCVNFIQFAFTICLRREEGKRLILVIYV